MATQVFGPDRPVAALRAINRLSELQTEIDEWSRSNCSPDSLYLKYNAAKAERDLYPEYADAATAQAHI